MKTINIFTIAVALNCASFAPLTGAHHAIALFPEIDSNKETVKGLPVKNDTPAWDLLYQGVHVVCVCKNKECPSKKSYVWINIGLGKFNIMEHFYNPIHCKACKEEVQLEDIRMIAFHDCLYTLQGAMITDKKKYDQCEKNSERKKLSIDDGLATSEGYEKYKTGPMAWWIFLTITASQIPIEGLISE